MQAEFLEPLILIVHVLASLCIIGLVLIQHGKGADMGSGFGGGSSGTVFGSGGAGNFLSKTTTSLAITFFLTSFSLAYFAKQKSVTVRNIGVPEAVQQVPARPEIELPVLDADSPVSELPPADAAETEIPQT
jgi:preprotein translocase subunit SecG